MSVLDDSPFPFEKPEAQQFWLALSDHILDEDETKQIAARHAVKPSTLQPRLSPRNLWHQILQRASGFGTVRALAKEIRETYPGPSAFAFLDPLIANQPAIVTRETGKNGRPPALDVLLDEHGKPSSMAMLVALAAKQGKDEARLFNDDGLWVQLGLVPALIKTLQKMVELAPGVCQLRVKSAGQPDMLGTGFRISKEWVMSNHHVLVPGGEEATHVEADFNFDVDAKGATTHQQPTLQGDTKTIVGEYDIDNGGTTERVDWAVVKIADMDPAGPIFDLSRTADPKRGDAAFVLQHPNGQHKRLGFVRNVITLFDARIIHYLTDTEEGSSGSPVLDANGCVLALHRGTDESGTFGGKFPVKKNEGIRITKLKTRPKLANSGALP